MSNKDATGSKPADRADWNSAWEIVARLAAAREGTLHEVEPPPVVARSRTSKPVAPVANVPAPTEPVDPDQLARAVAEIEKASAALRQAEPGLEVGVPDAPLRRGRYWSIWLLIGGVWISATLVVAGATGAILYLFG
jgi:hypothetical protein